MPEDQSQVLPSTTEDHVDGLTLSTFEVIAMHKAIVFHVSDDRFDGVASFKLAPSAGRKPGTRGLCRLVAGA